MKYFKGNVEDFPFLVMDKYNCFGRWMGNDLKIAPGVYLRECLIDKLRLS